MFECGFEARRLILSTHNNHSSHCKLCNVCGADGGARRVDERRDMRRFLSLVGGSQHNGFGICVNVVTNMNGSCHVLRRTRRLLSGKMSIGVNCVRARKHTNASTVLRKLPIIPHHGVFCGKGRLRRVSLSTVVRVRPRVMIISRLTRAGIRNDQGRGH